MEDPRYFVAIAPVPAWEMAKDAKLKARGVNQYNLGSPTRYEMFKHNYTRRLRQMSSQGFMSPPNKPYQPVGSLILNPKHLIKATLGQQKEEDTTESPRRKSFKENTVAISRTPRYERWKRPATAPIMSARASARSKKSLHNLQSIPASLDVVENTKNSVKKGHALFEVVTKPPEELMTSRSTGAKDGPVMRKQSVDSTEMQPGPKSLAVPTWLANIEMKPTVTISTSRQLRCDSYRSAEPTSQRLLTRGERKTYFLWRQMCALHWLIEACRIRQGLRDVSPSEVLVPLAKCWDEVNPGGRTIPRTISNHPNLERYTSSTSLQLPSRSPSRSESVSSVFGGRVSPKGFSSPQTTRKPSKDTMSNQDTTYSRTTTPAPTIILPDQTTSDQKPTRDDPFDDVEMSNYHNNLVKLLDTVKESVDKEMQFRQKVADNAADKKRRLRTPVYKWALCPYPKTPKGILTVTVPPSMSASQEIAQPPILRKPIIRPHTAGPRLKHPRRDSFRPDTPMTTNAPSRQENAPAKKQRPKSSPPKLRLNTATFSSDKREKTMVKLREQFQEVSDMKALRLHQSLSELQRSRVDRMEKKFEAFDTCQLSIDRDLKTMRSAIQNETPGSRCTSRVESVVVASSECEWFTNLVKTTSINEATDKPCKKVLEKLKISAAKFVGWQEDARCNKRTKPVNIMDHQITMESFVVILRRLRYFEIFAPDVSAAIEFMKNEIVKVPNEQFEDIIKKLV